jgi:hypothetical protein
MVDESLECTEGEVVRVRCIAEEFYPESRSANIVSESNLTDEKCSYSKEKDENDGECSIEAPAGDDGIFKQATLRSLMALAALTMPTARTALLTNMISLPVKYR